MPEENRQRPLERLNIDAETSLSDEFLSPSKAKAVRFRLSTPGYHYDDVDAYKESVDETLTAYAKAYHDRDLDIHKLDEELARAETTILNLRQKLELAEAKNNITQANADDDEVATLLEANQRLTNELAELNAWAVDAEVYVQQLEQRLASSPAPQPEVTDTVNEPAYSGTEYSENFTSDDFSEEQNVYTEPEYGTTDENDEVDDFVFTPAETTFKPEVNYENNDTDVSNGKSQPNKVDEDIFKKFPDIRPEDLN